MIEIPQNIIELVNNPGRVSVLCTADSHGKPNAAYFGSPRVRDGKTISMGLMGGRTLANLKENPNAVYFCTEKTLVDFATPACCTYLEVDPIHTYGELLYQIK